MDFFNHVTILAGLAVMAFQQILTLKAVPIAVANRYPVPTLIVLSIVASVLAVVFNKETQPHSFGGWVILVTSVGLTAAVVYNHTIRNWAQLRAMEAEK